MTTWWAEHAWLGGPRTASNVLIEEKDGRFTAVTPDSPRPPDAHHLRGLALPGLANVHSHAFHRALRGRTHEHAGSFWTWRRLMYDIANRFDPDTYHALARAVFAEMTLAGFTAVGEFHYLHHGPGGVPYDDPNAMGLAVIDAARQAGIRLTLLDTSYGHADEAAQHRFTDTDWTARVAVLPTDDMTRLGAAIHSVRAVPPDMAKEVAAYAAERDWPLHAHVSEQRSEHHDHPPSPLSQLAGGGAVTHRFTAVHGTHLSPDDISLLAANGAGCCVCPTTERDLGDGIGPFPALHAAGVPFSIGTDSHAVIDGFEEARAIELDSRLATEQRGLIPPHELLVAATSNGHHALGWNHAGRLAPNHHADFVTVRLDSPRTAGTDPTLAATAVFAATAADVDTVVVGGRTIVEDGHHSLIDDVPTALDAAIGAIFP